MFYIELHLFERIDYVTGALMYIHLKLCSNKSNHAGGGLGELRSSTFTFPRLHLQLTAADSHV